MPHGLIGVAALGDVFERVHEAAVQQGLVRHHDGATIRQTVLDLGYVERGELTEQQLDDALDVDGMTRP